MVNATIDNNPVSVLILSGQSVTVPSNEVWKVSLHATNEDRARFLINGSGRFEGNRDKESAPGNYLDLVFTGDTTIETTELSPGSVYISGFVVKS